MKTPRIALACALLAAMPPAFAISLEHTAKLTFCQLTNKVHGECRSMSKATIFNGTSSIDIDCKISRDGFPVSTRVVNVQAEGKTTSFTTALHTRSKTNVQFCAENRSKYRSDAWPFYPRYVGQQSSKKCQWVQGDGVDN